MMQFRLLFLVVIFFSTFQYVKGQGERIAVNNGFGTQKVKFSPNGQFYVTLNHNSIQFWKPESESNFHSIKTGGINTPTFDISPQGKKIVFPKKLKVPTGKNQSHNHAIISYVLPDNLPQKQIDSGEIVLTNDTIWAHSSDISLLKYSRSGRFLFSSGKEKIIKVWDLEADSLKWEAKVEKKITAVAIFENLLVTGDAKGDLKFRFVEDGSINKKLTQHNGLIRDVKFSPNGQILASCGDDNLVKLLAIEDDSISNIPLMGSGHSDWVYSLSISPDSKYLASGSRDQHLILWDLNRKNFLSRTKIRKGGSIGSVDFDPVGKYLATAPFLNEGVFLWDVSNLNISPPLRYVDETDQNPPQILITSPVVRGVSVLQELDELAIKGLVIDEFGVHQLFINGVKTSFSENGDFEAFLQLAMGENKIRIEATDVNNNTSVKNLSIIRKAKSDSLEMVEEAKNHLLVIGIDKYENISQLYNAVSDANAVKEMLVNKYNFSEKNTYLLTNEQATKNNITKSLRGLINQVKPQDNLIIYYSGHGHFDEEINEGFFIPTEGNPKNENTYLSNSFFLKIVEQIPVKHLFIIVDACFSGALFNNASRGFVDNVGKIQSRWCLASGRLEYVSDGNVGGHSPFCQALLDFLENQNEEKFAVSELVQYVKIHVANETDQTPLGSPLRIIGDQGGEFIFQKANKSATEGN